MLPPLPPPLFVGDVDVGRSHEQLRSTFYVTECETSSQEVFFFRKPVWAKFR